MKKIKQYFDEVIYISRITQVTKKRLRIILSVALSNVTVILDIAIIIFFAYIFTGESTDNKYVLYFLERIYFLPIIVFFRFLSNFVEKIKDAGLSIKELAVDGGACANNFLMQFQADILNTEIIRPKIIESTAWGAALLAGIKSNFFVLNDIKSNRSVEKKFNPSMPPENRKNWIKKWEKAIEALIAMYDQH